MRYQELIKTKEPKVEILDVQRCEHDEAEAIEAIASGLELVNLTVGHWNGKRVMGRRRTWMCDDCGFADICKEDRA